MLSDMEATQMTRTLSRGGVEFATRADLRAAVDHALTRAGCTFDELAAQAKTGHFDSMRGRLAWVAIGDLYRVDLGPDV
jgi:hypothetical protein